MPTVSTASIMRPRQLNLPISRAAPAGFDDFIAGPNGLAVAQVRDAALRHGSAPAAPPIYLWGPVGCGKTHLLQALARSMRAAGRGVAHFDARTPLPWHLDEAELTVFDGCDDFDAERQQAAFARFVDASSRGALVAAAGRVPPIDLPLRDDLRSRLGWGHVLALHPLSEGDVRQVLRNEARRRGLTLPDEVSAYLLTHFSRDLKSLMILLDRADDFALSQQRALTVPLIREMQGDAALAPPQSEP